MNSPNMVTLQQRQVLLCSVGGKASILPQLGWGYFCIKTPMVVDPKGLTRLKIIKIIKSELLFQLYSRCSYDNVFYSRKKKSSAIASAPPIKMLLCCKWNQPRASLLLMCSQACFSLFTVYFTCEYLPGMTLYYLTLLCTPSLLRKKMPREKKWSKCHSWIGMHSWIWRIYYCTHPTPQQYTCQGAGKYRRKPVLKYLIKHITLDGLFLFTALLKATCEGTFRSPVNCDEF